MHAFDDQDFKSITPATEYLCIRGNIFAACAFNSLKM